MKKKFEEPQLQIVELEMEDVIATSGGYGASSTFEDTVNGFDPPTDPLGGFIW